MDILVIFVWLCLVVSAFMVGRTLGYHESLAEVEKVFRRLIWDISNSSELEEK